MCERENVRDRRFSFAIKSDFLGPISSATKRGKCTAYSPFRETQKITQPAEKEVPAVKAPRYTRRPSLFGRGTQRIAKRVLEPLVARQCDICARKRDVGKKKKSFRQSSHDFRLRVSCGDSARGDGAKKIKVHPSFHIYIHSSRDTSVSHAPKRGIYSAEFHITLRQNTFPLLLLYGMVFIFCRYDGRIYFNNIFCKRKENAHVQYLNSVFANLNTFKNEFK